MAKPLQTLALLALLRSLLFVFNVLFWLSGLCLLLSGLWVVLHLEQYVRLERDLASAIPAVAAGLGFAVLAVASIACKCTINGSAAKIYIYSTLLFVVLVLELLVFLLGYKLRSGADLAFHDGISLGLQEYAKDVRRSAAIDAMQTKLRCCGVTNFSDWHKTAWGAAHAGNLPYSCCLWTERGVCSMQAHKEHEAELFVEGCYRRISNFAADNVQILLLVAVGVGLVQMVGLVLACLLARAVGKAHYEEIR